MNQVILTYLTTLYDYFIKVIGFSDQIISLTNNTLLKVVSHNI